MKNKKTQDASFGAFDAEQMASEIKDIFSQTSRLLIRLLYQFKIFPNLTQVQLANAKQKILEKNKNNLLMPLPQKEKLIALEQQYSQEEMKSLIHRFQQDISKIDLYALTSLKTYNKQLEATKNDFLYHLALEKGVEIIPNKCFYYGTNIFLEDFEVATPNDNLVHQINDNHHNKTPYYKIILSLFNNQTRTDNEVLLLDRIINKLLKNNDKQIILATLSKEIAQSYCVGQCHIYPSGELPIHYQKNPTIPVLFEIFGTHTNSAKVIPLLSAENILDNSQTLCLSPDTYYKFEKARVSEHKTLVITIKASTAH